MSTADGPGELPVIPPDSFVASFNTSAMAAGRPFRSALDPLVMMAWHLASGREAQQSVVLPEV